MKLFPIMVGHRGGIEAKTIREFGDIFMVVAIPWDMIAPHEGQAQKNHGQTLERLAERGGLDAIETVAVLTDKNQYHLTGIHIADANNIILNAIAAFQHARETALPDGVMVVGLDDSRRLHTAIANALGEPGDAAEWNRE